MTPPNITVIGFQIGKLHTGVDPLHGLARFSKACLGLMSIQSNLIEMWFKQIPLCLYFRLITYKPVKCNSPKNSSYPKDEPEIKNVVLTCFGAKHIFDSSLSCAKTHFEIFNLYTAVVVILKPSESREDNSHS